MKIIVTLLVLAVSLSASAQIEVSQTPAKTTIGKVSSAGSMIAELYYRVIDADTVYTIMFNNYEYKTITDYQSVSFSSTDGTLDKLYSLMKSVFSDENKKNKEYKVDIKLGKTDVILSNFRTMGVTQLMFWMSKGYVLLSEKQVDKLFSK